MSSLTEQPTVAAITSFGLLLLLWILDWAGSSGTPASGLLGYLSLLNHYDPLLKGMFSSVDVSYYLLLTVLFLGFSIRRLDADRLQH
jgi:ABC-2 type transport system permease protein